MRLLTDRPRSATDLALLLVRVALGVVFVAHGWQKWSISTIEGTQASFEASGVPMASVAAPALATLEVAGGLALVAGLLTPVVAALLAASMVGAIAFVHGGSGFYASDGGYEFVLVLGLACVAVAISGAGRFSVDHLLGRGSRATADDREPVAAR